MEHMEYTEQIIELKEGQEIPFIEIKYPDGKVVRCKKFVGACMEVETEDEDAVIGLAAGSIELEELIGMTEAIKEISMKTADTIMKKMMQDIESEDEDMCDSFLDDLLPDEEPFPDWRGIL